MIPHCLDNRLTDGGKVVSPTHRQRFIPQKHYMYASHTHFCWRLGKHQGLVRPEGLGIIKNFIHPIWSRIRDLSAYSALTTMLPRPHLTTRPQMGPCESSKAA
jgi:hypothetical protein